MDFNMDFLTQRFLIWLHFGFKMCKLMFQNCLIMVQDKHVSSRKWLYSWFLYYWSVIALVSYIFSLHIFLIVISLVLHFPHQSLQLFLYLKIIILFLWFCIYIG